MATIQVLGGRVPWPAATSTPPDLVAAAVAALKNDAGVAGVVTGTNGVCKVYADEAVGPTDLPYVVFTENTITFTPESPDADGVVSLTGQGELTVDVYAVGKVACKTLRQSVVELLHASDLSNADTTVHYFRLSRPLSPPAPGTNVGVPQAYRATATFAVIVEQTIVPS